MYQICLIPRSDNPSLPAVFLCYKSNEKAKRVHKALAKAKGEKAEIYEEDDYGYILAMNAGDILHALYNDLERSEICRLEKNLCTARTGKKLMERVKADPEENELLNLMRPQDGNSSDGIPKRAPSRILSH